MSDIDNLFGKKVSYLKYNVTPCKHCGCDVLNIVNDFYKETSISIKINYAIQCTHCSNKSESGKDFNEAISNWESLNGKM